MTSEPIRIGEYEGRHLFLLELSGLQDLSSSTFPFNGPFTLLVTGDFQKVNTADLVRFTERLLSLGAVYTVSWGPGSDEIETHFDSRVVERGLNGGVQETEDNVVLTVTKSNESLGEALWYFLETATPAPAYKDTCKSGLIITVGASGLSGQIRRHLQDPAGFVQEYVDETPPE